MLHNTCMFCLIKFIFISENLSLHCRHVQKCLQNIRSNYRELHHNRNTHHKLQRKIHDLHIIKDTLVLNATAVSDYFFKVTKKAYHAIIWDALRNTQHFSAILESTEILNYIINIPLPLIFHQNAVPGILVPQ